MIGIHFESSSSSSPSPSSSSSSIESYIRNFNNENQCLSPGTHPFIVNSDALLEFILCMQYLVVCVW